MIAVDTNVLVRYLADDDTRQHTLATSLFEAEQIFVPVTVLLEAEWVLRATFRMAATQIMRTFQALAGIPTVTIQSRHDVLWAIDLSLQGLDFADALHLATTRGVSRLVTFDRTFVRKSRGLGRITVAEL